MTPSTANYAWPYPAGTDAVLTHTDIQKLGVAADATLQQTDARVGATEGRVTALENPPTRKAGVPLTFSRGSGTDERATVTVRIPVKFGAPVKRMRVGFRNYDYRSGTPFTGPLTIRGVAFGEHQMNADGSMSGLFPTDPQILSGQITAPEDASTFSTVWATVNAEANKEYLLSYTILDSPISKVYNLGFCFTSLIAAGWQIVGPTTATPQSFIPLTVNLEVEVDANTPVYAYLGDSHTAGQGATRPGYDSWANLHARTHGAIAQIYAEPGSSLSEWADPLDPAWRRFQHLDKPDRLHMALGYNDFASSSITLATAQDRWNTTMGTAMGFVDPNLYLSTLLPRPDASGATAVQAAFSEWLSSSLPGRAKGCYDFARALVDPSTGLIDSRWRTAPTDGHPTSAGYARLAETTTLPEPTANAGLLTTYLTARGA